MTVKYSSLFTVTGAITKEPVTICVELIEAEGFQGVCVESLEGRYASQDEFDKDFKNLRNGKIRNFLPMKLPDARRLADTLNETLEASGC